MLRASVLAGFVAVLAVPRAAHGASDEPYYFERAIVRADLKGKTLRELALLEATIHARAGQVFLKWWLRDHFAGRTWYHPGRYDASQLSAVNRANLRTIEVYRAAVLASELRARYQALVERHAYAFQSPAGAVAFSPDGSRFVTRATAMAHPSSRRALGRGEWKAGDARCVGAPRHPARKVR